MKFTSLAVAILALAVPAFSLPAIPASGETQQILTYDKVYDDPLLPLTKVACSNGENGLITRGYTTLGSLSHFPHLGGVQGVGWNSPLCGSCWAVVYNDKTLYVLAVDSAENGFNLSEEAVNELTNDQAKELGSVEVWSYQVPGWFCGFDH